mgnify:CR=1 FL=1
MKTIKKLFIVTLSVLFAFPFAACGKNDKKLIVGATASPHAEILEFIKSDFEAKGYKLEIKQFSKYETINPATDDGSLDANFFQHKPFLDNYNSTENGNLVSVGAVHFEPLGAYSVTGETTDSLKNSSAKVVLVPNDKTNEARALLLLEANGLITLKSGAGLNATKADIVSNPYSLEVKELAAELITNSLKDCALAVINGNYALSAGLSLSDAVAVESSASEAAKTYANIVACKRENANDPKILALIECLHTDKVADFIANKYKGGVVAVF